MRVTLAMLIFFSSVLDITALTSSTWSLLHACEYDGEKFTPHFDFAHFVSEVTMKFCAISATVLSIHCLNWVPEKVNSAEVI